MKTPTTMFVFLFTYLLTDFSTADSICPDPVDRTTVREFHCTVRTQTGVYGGGSDNHIYLKLFDTSFRQTEWYLLHNQNLVDFRPGTIDLFTMIFSGIAPAIHYIEIKEYYNPRWWLVYLELYCPDVKIDMRFSRDGYINNRDQRLITSTQTLCPDRGTISNGTMTCSDDTKWGSVCHYKCDSLIVHMRGPDCVYCRQNGTWSAPVDSTMCEKIICPPRNLTNGNINCTDGLLFQSTCTYACDEGFVLRGSNSATCLLSAHWSVDLPSCEATARHQMSSDEGLGGGAIAGIVIVVLLVFTLAGLGVWQRHRLLQIAYSCCQQEEECSEEIRNTDGITPQQEERLDTNLEEIRNTDSITPQQEERLDTNLEEIKNTDSIITKQQISTSKNTNNEYENQ